MAATAGLGAASCAPAAKEGGFESPNPAAHLYAIEYAVHDRDADRIPQIVELLDSDDPAVRFAAIEALDRLTGMRLEYEYDAPRRQREAAVRRWVAAVESGEALSRGRATSGAAHD